MKKWLQYLILVIAGALIALAVLLGQNAFSNSGALLMRNLCDAFFVPAVIILGLGLLIFSTEGGTFDMIAFGFIKLFDLFKKDLTKVKYRTFYDYRKAQSDKKRHYASYLIVGLVFLVLSISFLIAYNSY